MIQVFIFHNYFNCSQISKTFRFMRGTRLLVSDCVSKYKTLLFLVFGLNVTQYLAQRTGIAQWYSAGLRGGWSGVRVPEGAGNFSTVSRPALGPTQPPIQWVLGTLSLEVKRPGREGDHSPPSSAEVKNAWSYTSGLLYIFMSWCSV
jgi:hypothetical protein